MDGSDSVRDRLRTSWIGLLLKRMEAPMRRLLALLSGLLIVSCTQTVRPKDPGNCLRIVYGQGEDRRAVTAKAVRLFSDKRVEAIDLQFRTGAFGMWFHASGNMTISGDYTITEGKCTGH
jgi:hypothetical protein